jgi:hypothetical protein
MKLTGHKTELVYRRYAIVSEADLAEGVGRLAALHATSRTLPAQSGGSIGTESTGAAAQCVATAGGCAASHHQHRVPVGVEAVALGHGVRVRAAQ